MSLCNTQKGVGISGFKECSFRPMPGSRWSRVWVSLLSVPCFPAATVPGESPFPVELTCTPAPKQREITSRSRMARSGLVRLPFFIPCSSAILARPHSFRERYCSERGYMAASLFLVAEICACFEWKSLQEDSGCKT